MKIIRAEDRCDEVVEVLSDAFFDDPLPLWLCGARGNDSLRVSFSAMTHMFAKKGRVYAVEESDGALSTALLLHPPGLKLTVPAWIVSGFWRFPLRFGYGGFRRLLTYSAHADELLDPMHESGPHWYVDTLGVRRSHHGKGRGSLLTKHVLSETDGAPAILLTHRVSNVGFYESLGFQVLRNKDVPGSSITSVLMRCEDPHHRYPPK